MRRPRALVVAVLVVVAVALPAAAPERARAAVPPAPALGLVSETSVVVTSGAFTTELRVAGTAPGQRLLVTGFGRLDTRTGFTAALRGHPGAVVYPTVVTSVSSLVGPDGNVVVTIPINRTGTEGGQYPTFYPNPRYDSSVYPVTFQLASGRGVAVGQPLTGWFVYSSGAAAVPHPLAAAIAVPVTGPADPGPTVRRLPPGASAAAAALAGVLAAHPEAPVTLAVSPDLVARLAAGGTVDHQTVTALAGAVGAGDELLTGPYLPTDLAALDASGLQAEAATAAAAGASTLTALLHHAPDPDSSVMQGQVDPGHLAAAAAAGARHVVVPDAALTPLPASDDPTSSGRPAVLNGRGVPALPVMGTDRELSSLLDAGGDATLDARDVVAGLALVQQLLPSTARGVALEVPPGGAVDPAILDGVLTGLADYPFVTPVTVDGLFAALPVTGGAPQRSPVDTRPVSPIPYAGALRVATSRVQGLASMLEPGSKVTGPLRRQLLSAASDAVDPAGRAALLAAVDAAVTRTVAGVTLPGSSSVTLTSRTGTIPLTVLSNPGLAVRAALRIASPKLTFLPFAVPGAGHCTVGPVGAETCPLLLGAEVTTVRIPVESRTSGVFGLEVTLASPDGGLVLATNRDTVRSTAFSGVGIVLIVVAGLGLAVWWVRNARHGRRARQLVDPPTGEVPTVVEQVVAVPSDVDRSWGDDDPVIAEFFASPAPEWQPASPSGPPGGPTP